MNSITELILKLLDEKGEVKTSEIVKITGFSRVYINRFFQNLKDRGKVILIGKANSARYIPATKKALMQAKKDIRHIHRILQNKELSEDLVLDRIKNETGILMELSENVTRIVSYAFTEMLNNAIEHSGSETIEVIMERDKEHISFDIIDSGVGIFNNIVRKKRFNDDMEAIQNLMKGKLTTASESHSGEGIFFTSKVADKLILQGVRKKLIFDNLINDIFIKGVKKNAIGTKVFFSISVDSKRELSAVFKEYTDESVEFNKTEVKVKLYKAGPEYVSRSQARRILSGLGKFKTILLDFDGVETIGQGFADEVFRIWKQNYPDVKIIPSNANKNVQFMIERAVRH